MKFYFILFVFLFSVLFSNSQELEIIGIVKNSSTDLAIDGASIVVKNDEETLGYTYTDQKGFFTLRIKKNNLNEILIECNSLGFSSYSKTIQLLDNELIVMLDIKLTEKIEKLSEVVIQSDKKIKINKDTISYKISAFKNGSEKTVEDMLKQLPGIEVSETGVIRVMGKPIQKILIEGDDLSGSNYKVISKNLDISAINKIEVINNYEENHVLKQFIESENVALNLKLKDSKKSVVFGKAELGLGIKSRYNGDLNLGVINKKFKLLDLAFLNNTGKIAETQHSNYQYNEASIGSFNKDFTLDTQPINLLDGSSIQIDDKYYIENNTFSNNLLINKRFSDSLSVRNSFFIYQDKYQKEYSNFSTYILEPEPLVYNEVNNVDNRGLTLGNDIKLNYKPSKKSNLVIKNTLTLENDKNTNHLVFNDDLIKQKLKNKSKNADIQLQYTQKINNGAFVTDVFAGYKDLNQSFRITPNTLTINDEPHDSSIINDYSNILSYQGVENIWLKKHNSITYSYGGGFLNLIEHSNVVAYDKEDMNLILIDSLSGKNKASSFEPYLNLNFRQKLLNRFFISTSINPKLSVYKNDNKSNTFFIPSYKINLIYSKSQFGSFTLGHSYKSEIPRLQSFVDNYLLKSYRTIVLGSKNIEVLKRQSFFFNHNYANIDKRLFLNTTLSYNDYKNQIANLSTLTTDQDILQRAYISGQKFVMLNIDLTTYFKFIQSSIKFGLQNQRLLSPQIINSEEVNVINKTTSYYISGTSFFRGLFNYKFLLQYTLNRGENSNTIVKNNRYNSDLKLIFNLNKALSINIDSNLYFIDSEFYETNSVEIEYKPVDKNWFLGLRVQNIFNTESYVFNNVSGFNQSRLIFEAVPSYGYVYYSFRF